MKNELTVNNKQAIVKLGEQNIGDIIKPLSTEIHLFDSYVAGIYQLKDNDILETLKIGDKLTLQREDSKFDSNAINILTESGNKIGYIPEKDNVIFARLMDAGKLLIAKVKNIKNDKTFKIIEIGIYLIDY